MNNDFLYADLTILHTAVWFGNCNCISWVNSLGGLWLSNSLPLLMAKQDCKMKKNEKLRVFLYEKKEIKILLAVGDNAKVVFDSDTGEGG